MTIAALLLLLSSITAQEYNVPFGPPAPSGACTTQSVLYSQDTSTHNGISNTFDNGIEDNWGQFFTADTNATLYSIQIWPNACGTTTLDWELRFGSCASASVCDFRTVYAASVIRDNAGMTQDAMNEFIFAAESRPTITNTNGYGFFIIAQTSSNCRVGRRIVDVFAAGEAISNQGDGNGSWFTDTATTADDLRFIIKKCN